jgi:hypothetical protein
VLPILPAMTCKSESPGAMPYDRHAFRKPDLRLAPEGLGKVEG